MAIADIPINYAEAEAAILNPSSPGPGDDSPIKDQYGPPQDQRAVNKTDYKSFKEKQTKDIKSEDLFVQ